MLFVDAVAVISALGVVVLVVVVFVVVASQTQRLKASGKPHCCCRLSPPLRSAIRHDGDLTVEALEEFETRYFAGELRRHTKSEALSEDDELGPVKTVKTGSFRRMVVDNGE